jgi:hypothetical protein
MLPVSVVETRSSAKAYFDRAACPIHPHTAAKARGSSYVMQPRSSLIVRAKLPLHAESPVTIVLPKSVKSDCCRYDQTHCDELLMALERGPVHEAYIFTWFYGPVCELGHLHPNQIQVAFYGMPLLICVRHGSIRLYCFRQDGLTLAIPALGDVYASRSSEA